MPKRIQRRRTKGWKMPPNCVYVGRPTEWSNPYKVGRDGTAIEVVDKYRKMIGRNVWTKPNKLEIQVLLKGRDLACWCPLVDKDGNPVPCHVDVLLEIANGR